MKEEPRASRAVRLEPGRVMFAGELRSTHEHAHAALQILFVGAGRVSLVDAQGRASPVRAAIIPTGVAHAMQAEDALGAIVYLDPTAQLARMLDALVEAQARAARSDRHVSQVWVDAAEAAVPILSTGAIDLAGAERAMMQLSGMQLTATGEAAPSLSRAVREALALLPELAGGPIRLDEVAAAVCLSPSRLRHLFVDELGLPFTSCVRWARLKAAMQAVGGGSNLTQAAHAAGFADSAHLTRVFRAMFGLAPSTAVQDLCWC